jgi:L-glutamine-phosphate cytidylyltransferase
MTKVLILAAGQGSRLRPITNDKPKCLVPLLGKSLLQRQTDVLEAAGLTNIHIATGYRSDQIEKLGYKTSLNTLYDKTNMVESLFSALEFIEGEEDLIIAYGDIVYQQNNLEKLLSSNDDIALMIDKEWKAFWSLRLENPLDDAETLKLDTNGFVTELGKKTESYEDVEGQYTGLIKIRGNKISEFIKFYNSIDREQTFDGQDFNNMYMTSFLQMMIDSGWKAKAVLVNNGWLEIDTVEDLSLYENLALNDQLKNFMVL